MGDDVPTNVARNQWVKLLAAGSEYRLVVDRDALRIRQADGPRYDRGRLRTGMACCHLSRSCDAGVSSVVVAIKKAGGSFEKTPVPLKISTKEAESSDK